MRSSLKELLPELPGGIYRGTAFAARALEDRWEPIGLSVLDARIGGGLPVGRCSEFFGSLSGGSTNLAIRLMSEVTASGRSVGWIGPRSAGAGTFRSWFWIYSPVWRSLCNGFPRGRGTWVLRRGFG